MYATKISSPQGMVPSAYIRSSRLFALNVNLAFGEHEWLKLALLKQIPPEPETANEFVLNMPSK